MSLCGIQLSSTPPLSAPTPSPAARSGGGKRGATLVSFRSGLSDHEAGSFKSGLSRSLTADGAGSLSLSRSLGGRGRTTSVEGGSGAGAAAFSALASASASSCAARPLQATASIPKSAQFVKIEGFATRDSSPAGSAPPSPQQPRVLSSLLSRQLSTDRLPILGSSGGSLSSSLAASCGSGAMLGGSMPVGLDDPVLGLAARLEGVVRVGPVPRPAPLARTRSSIPDNLLQHLQHSYAVFREPVCVRAFGIARAAHDGKYRASGEPAFMHCVEVARILAELGADEGTVSGAPASLHSFPARARQGGGGGGGGRVW